MRIVHLKTFADKRGSLSENTLPEIMRKSRHFFISRTKPGEVRGNHYHHKKTEWFYVIQGTCNIVVENIKTKKREYKTVNASENIVVLMEPLKAHAFKNTGQNELILLALINEVLDQKNPDTYEYKLL